MARRKRAYIPKIKGASAVFLSNPFGLTDLSGCYECSQRRIDCDRAEPICGKCMSRGLPCSGLVKSRIRFVDNQVARNDRAGRTGSHASRANSASRVDDEFGSSVDIDQIPLSLDVLDGRSTYLLQYCRLHHLQGSTLALTRAHSLHEDRHRNDCHRRQQ